MLVYNSLFVCVLQAKLRLEMEMVSLRQTHSKDIESKDEEVEEIRQSCSKKVWRPAHTQHTTVFSTAVLFVIFISYA